MEESGAMAAKRVWSMVRALYFMFRKDKSHKKIMLDIKMMLKRGKLARKAFQSLMFNQHDKMTIADSQQQLSVLPGEYIFSCSDTPLFRLHSRRNGSTSHRFFSCAHATPTLEDGDEMSVNVAVRKALEMLQSDHEVVRSPVGRIPDSLYRIGEVHEEESCVDEAAEEFIRKFYKDLKKQT
ncbi:hypothetical protein DCAR_0208562 [Daucus carota subsp. sativus]|uniref:Avr9/Cf-9 rapidly elicited protein 146 n=1 Tax=Daucus carota subsp. sativus TaxID=79200 RepID=A0A166ELY5_DAUCS|nr:PREDICTED: uncharacterized protein LOC108207722 [Daucus carota subsp. sativus]WOG89324.1 hypothetical protein DCAR_0208562 [Daucus carota subsp. sativus]